MNQTCKLLAGVICERAIGCSGTCSRPHAPKHSHVKLRYLLVSWEVKDTSHRDVVTRVQVDRSSYGYVDARVKRSREPAGSHKLSRFKRREASPTRKPSSTSTTTNMLLAALAMFNNVSLKGESNAMFELNGVRMKSRE